MVMVMVMGWGDGFQGREGKGMGGLDVAYCVETGQGAFVFLRESLGFEIRLLIRILHAHGASHPLV